MNLAAPSTTGGNNQSSNSSFPSTPNIVETGAPECKLPDGMVIPYILPEDMGLTKPTGVFSDIRSVDPGTANDKDECFDNKRVTCQVDKDHWTSNCERRAHIWNWGAQQTSATETPSAIATEFKSQMPRFWNLPIIQSLIKDLHVALYGQLFQDRETSPFFECLTNRANGFLNYILLIFDHQKLFESGRPISHIIVDIIASINYLRDKAEMKDDASVIDDQLLEFKTERKLFWKGKLTATPENQSWLATNWEAYSTKLSYQVDSILREVKAIMLLSPEDPKDAAYFRDWDGDQRLRQHALIRCGRVPNFRDDIYNSAGIKPGELNVSVKATANLSDFRASVLRNGAFKIKLTREPSLHLRFNEKDEMRPTLHILDTRTISNLALLDLTGFMSKVDLPTYLVELFASHALFFGRSTPSPKMMQSQFAGIDKSIVKDYHDKWSSSISTAHISDFPIYGSRLETIHQRMTDWRPLHLKDLRHRPYRGSVTYYALIFAAIFGVLQIASFILSTISFATSGSKGQSIIIL